MSEEVKSYSQMRKEFYEKYTKKIVPFLQKHESIRKIKLFTAIAVAIILIFWGSFLVYLVGSTGAHGKSAEGTLKLAFMLYALAYLSWTWIKKGFENKIKEKIMPTVCSCFGDMKWSNRKYSGGHIFSESNVIPNYTSEFYDDIFKGSYKDVNIEIVESEYDVGRGRNRRIVFNGVIVKLDMNKSFTGHTVIKPNSLMHISPSSKLRFTEFEDIEFNKKFDVFTNDEVDARYLITPTFMVRLKNMTTAFKANSVSCAFFGNFLIVAMSTRKDLFSICSLTKPIDDRAQYFLMYEEIFSIIRLIDHFKLDQKIGL